MNYYTKLKIIASIVIVSMVSIGYWITIETNKEIDIYNSNLGKKILIDSDSLTIINCNRLEHTYTLSNGALINATLVNKKAPNY
jgi:hypothetical protein